MHLNATLLNHKTKRMLKHMKTYNNNPLTADVSLWVCPAHVFRSALWFVMFKVIIRHVER